MQCPRCSFRMPAQALVCARCGEQTPRALALSLDTRPPWDGPRKAVSREIQINRRGAGVRAVGTGRARQPMWVRGSENGAAPPSHLRIVSSPANATVPVAPSTAAASTARAETTPVARVPVAPAPSTVHHAKTEPAWHREPKFQVSRISVAELPFQRSSSVWESAPLSSRLGAATIDAAVVLTALAVAVGLGLLAFGPARVAPFWDRGFDYVVDGLLVRQRLGLFVVGLGACLALVYSTLSHAILGATFGKRAFGLRVIDVEDERPGLGVAAARAVASFASLALACVGYAFALFDGRRLTLHDRLVGTRVVLDATEASEDELPEGGAEDAPRAGSEPSRASENA